MRQSKITHYLLLLSEQEWPLFQDFLASPYFNRQADAERLFGIMRDEILKKPENNLTEEECAALLWPQEAFPKIRFRKLKSALLDLCLKFMTDRAIRQDAGAAETYLLRGLNQRGEFHYFHQNHEAALQILERRPARDKEYYRHLFEVSEEWARHKLSLPGRTDPNPLKESFEALEMADLLEKITFAHALREFQHLTSQHYHIQGISQMLDEIDRRPGLAPIFPIMANLYRISDQLNDEASFYRLKELLHQHAHKFSQSQAHDFYISAVNFCVRKTLLGQEAWIVEQFELHKAMLKSGIILHKGHIHATNLQSLSVSAALNHAWDWLGHLLEGFRKRTLHDPTGSIFNYCEALLAFGRQDFARAERHLNQVLQQIDDIYVGLDARALLLKVYYESHNPVGMESLVNSFRVLLDRDKRISRSHKDHYQTFIKLFRRLINTPPRHEKRLNKLREELGKCKVSDRRWFQQKIESLLA